MQIEMDRQGDRSHFLRDEFSEALASVQPKQKALSNCAELLMQGADATGAHIWAVRDGSGSYQLEAEAGSTPPAAECGTWLQQLGLDPEIYTAGDGGDESSRPLPFWAGRHDTAAIATFPLVIENRRVGIVLLFGSHPFRNRDLSKLTPLLHQLAQYAARKQVEERLQESELRYRLVSQAANDAIWDWDLSTNQITWNEGIHTHFGYRADQVDPSAIWWIERIHPSDRDRVVDGIHDAIGGGSEIWQCEYRYRRADGSYAEVLDRGRVVHDENGRPVRMVGSMLDLTERKRSERAVRESQRRLQLVSDHVPAMISFVDREHRYQFSNARYEEWFGLKSDQVVGKHLRELLGEEIYAQRVPYIRRVLNGETVTFEGPTPHRGLGVRNTQLSYVPHYGPEGRVEGFYVMVSDITDRKRAELLLEAQKQSLEMMVSGVPLAEVLNYLAQTVERQCDGAAVASILLLDEEGRLRNGASPSLPLDYVQAIDGIKAESAVGTCSAAAATGQIVVTPDIDSDPKWQHLKPYPLALGFRAAWSKPITARDGRVLGTFGTYFRQSREPTELERQTVEMLARTAAIAIERTRAEERLRLLWESAAILLAADDPATMMDALFAKVCRHLGIDTYFNFVVNESGEALRMASWVGIPEDTAKSIQKLAFGESVCGTVALNRRPIVASHVQQSDDSKLSLVRSLGIRSYACHPLLAENRLIGTLSFASRIREQFDPDDLAFMTTLSHYVTMAYERLRLVERLRDADRRKDEFLAMLAHELRNPLAPLRNALELLRLADGNAELIAQARSLMERQVSQMVRLVDDLLDVARITRGKLELRKERVELGSVVQNALDGCRPLVQQMKHKLIPSLNAQPIYLDADPVRLTQVFLNVLNNAAKYTPRGGQIWLTVERFGSDAVVTVKDTGVGIASDKLPAIFDIFTQLDRSLDRSQGGIGLGLTLVKRLTEMHGGTVEARSTGPNQGSEFVVRLPVLIGDDSHVPVVPERPMISARRRILVVDDNRDGADSLAMMLRLIGNRVQTAYDGIEAVQLAEGFRPEIILLDIGLPKLNGYEAARQIRSEPWGKNIVLIAVTGWGQDTDRERSVEAGFNFHMVKPVSPDDLERLFASLLTPA